MLVITDGEPNTGGSLQNNCGDQLAAAIEVGKMCRQLEDFGMYGICFEGRHGGHDYIRRLWEQVFGKEHVVVSTSTGAIRETFKGLTALLMRRRRNG